jgi:c-di-GMP phosphodiesterase
VKRDISLTYRVLRSVNSARFGGRFHPAALGAARHRPGACVGGGLVDAGLTSQGAQEIVSIARIRAHCCEWLGERMNREIEPGSLFLIGLCSLLDVMLETPMTAAVEHLPLSPAIKERCWRAERTALAPRHGDCVRSGRWADAARGSVHHQLNPRLLSAAYTEGLQWARELQRGVLEKAG